MNLRPLWSSLTVLCLTGCVLLDNEPMPKQSQTAHQTTLDGFAGAYRLKEAPADHASFGFLESRERSAGDVLRLTPEPPSILVRYESGGKVVQTGRIDTSSREVRLEHGSLICNFPVSKGGAILPGPSFSSGMRTTMYFAEDGDLIVATQTWEAAAPLLIAPFYESRRRVHRFQRIAQ